MRTVSGIPQLRVGQREIDSWPVGKPFSLAPRMSAVTLDVIMGGVFGILGTPMHGGSALTVRDCTERGRHCPEPSRRECGGHGGVRAAHTEGVRAAGTEGVRAAHTEGARTARPDGFH